jgi:hypothetical protein
VILHDLGNGLLIGLVGGGGLAITALLAAGMKVPQHVTQALALAVTTLPLTLAIFAMAAFMAWRAL